MDLLRRIADARINDAITRGEFEGLAGYGRPIELDDLSRVPAEWRLAYKVLKNADVVPPEVELRREIYRLGTLIAETDDEVELRELRRRRLEAELHFNVLMERRSARGFGLRAARRR